MKALALVFVNLLFIPYSNAANIADTSPYSGQEQRNIPALSRDQQAGLLAGKGMGFAKAAELNGYPGPAHVLELSSKLNLNEEQIDATEALFNRMQTKAKSLGLQLVDAERHLNELFRAKQATEHNVTQALNHIGELRAKLRAAHILAHLEQASLLTKHQIAAYDKFRGYSTSSPRLDHGHHPQPQPLNGAHH